MKIESYQAMEEKKAYKIVLRSDCSDVEGDIVDADEATGTYSVVVRGETKTTTLGPETIRIVRRSR